MTELRIRVVGGGPLLFKLVEAASGDTFAFCSQSSGAAHHLLAGAWMQRCPLLCNSCATVVQQLCNSCCGTVLQQLLWNSCCGTVVVQQQKSV